MTLSAIISALGTFTGKPRQIMMINKDRTTYYDRIKGLSDHSIEIGFKRLGRVLKGSRTIQNLTGRQIFSISENLYGVGISATHLGDIERGNRILRPDTLERLVPFLFKVDHFEFVGDDQIGLPHFTYKGRNYKGTQEQIKMRVMTKFQANGTNEIDRPKLSQLPDIDYRYKTSKELVDIILGDNKIMSIKALPKQHHSNTPMRSFA